MCLDNRLSKEEVKAYVEKLPKELYVYKEMIDDYPVFSITKLTGKEKIYKAKNEPTLKTPIDYEPGFHSYQAKYYFILRKFKIKKEWITEVGTYRGCRCFVTSHIQTL